MTTPPQIIWEESEGLLSGSVVLVRGAAMPEADQVHGAVMLTVRVPEELFEVVREDGSGVATIMLNPDEARGIAAWLDEAAHEADQVGPPLYEDEYDGGYGDG